MWIKIRNAFIAGIAIIFPLFATIMVLTWLVNKLNSWVLNPLTKSLRPYLESHIAFIVAKTTVFFLVILIISLIGWAASILVLRKFFGVWEGMFLRIPFFGKIYSALKQVSKAFLGEGKAIFKSVVIVEYPRKGLYSVGFVTGETQGELQKITPENVTNVFIPSTPNPTTGFLILVPKKEIIEAKMSVEDGMKLVISGGVVVPEAPENMSK